MNILGIDIGGSSVKGAPVDTVTGKLLGERFKIETPEQLSPKQEAKLIAEIAKHFNWSGPIGVGFPGVVTGNTIRTSANLHKDFIDLDAVKLISKATGSPVGLINDAAAAGLAEMKFGAGKGFMGKTLLLTLGTGVGSAIAYQGVLIPTELGHLPMKGESAELRVSSAAKKRLDLSWEEWGGKLTKYIGTLEKILWPELIIIGGGVSAKHEKFFQYVETRAKMVPAQMLNDAGIVGAALAALPPPKK